MFAAEEHVAVEVTWWVYQQIIAAYADPDHQHGKTMLTTAIGCLQTELPAGLDGLAQLKRSLHQCPEEVHAY